MNHNSNLSECKRSTVLIGNGDFLINRHFHNCSSISSHSQTASRKSIVGVAREFDRHYDGSGDG